MTSRFEARSSQQPVETLVDRVNSKSQSIILNPPYQRDIVWEESNMGFFINSVLSGIVPSNIIFNMDDNGNKICIDGKQRLTSLQRFKGNEIPAIFQMEEKDEYVYYDKLPNKVDRKDQYAYRLLTQAEKNKFNGMNLHIVTYENLSYSDQIDIFNRIQHGKTLSSGEKISAFFSNNDVMKAFNEFCDKKQTLLSKYIKNTKRKEYVPHIVLIMYSINKSIKKPPEAKQKEMYLKSIDSKAKLAIPLKKIDRLIDICYGPDLLGHNSITTKLQQNVRLMTLYLVNTLFVNKFNSITELQFKYLRSAVKKTYRDMSEGFSKIVVTKTDIKTVEGIYNLINKYYNDLVKHNCEISEEDEGNDVEEEQYSEEENEEEEEIIIVPPKKIIKKVIINKK